MQFSERDLFSNSFGIAWGHTRNYANLLSNNSTGTNGNSWLIHQVKNLTLVSPTEICIVDSANASHWFVLAEGSSTQYLPMFNGQDSLTYDPVHDLYTFLDTTGRQAVYYGTSFGVVSGQIKTILDRNGNQASPTYNSSGNITGLVQTAGGATSTFQYLYYGSTAPEGSRGLISAVIQSVNGTLVRQVLYSYYNDGDSGGSAGDTQFVTVQQWQPGVNSGIWIDITKKYYRYYLSGEPRGFTHGLKYVLRGSAYQGLVDTGIDPLTSTDTQLAQYANFYFEYDSQNRVSLERLKGGQLQYSFTYQRNPSLSSDPNIWQMLTTETLPDGNQTCVYSNGAGQIILKILKQTNTENQWYSYTEYDENFNAALQASSSAVETVSEPSLPSSTELTVNLYANSGLIRQYFYYTETNLPLGKVDGYIDCVAIQQGTAGDVTPISKILYTSQSAYGHTIYPISSRITYPNSTDQPAATSYNYSWYEDGGGNPTFQINQMTITPPIIAVGQNGTGLAEPSDKVFDTFGRIAWDRNARGYISSYSYDSATGALIQVIRDVDITQATNPPPGWSTPSGGGLNLITNYISDLLGRTLKVLRPWIQIDASTVGVSSSEVISVRPVDYSYYLDSKRQLWTASGYLSGNDLNGSWNISSPVSIWQKNSEGLVIDRIQASAECCCAALGCNTFGGADEMPPQCEWTLWRHNKIDPWGQILQSQVYFLIPRSGPGVVDVNYNCARFGYDIMGRQYLNISPGGTITQTVFEPRGLQIAKWIGTNNSGATPGDPSGGGSAGNNMQAVWLGVYDGGASGGNGNLSQTILPVDSNSLNNRVTTFEYDFRDRQIQVVTSDGSTSFFDTAQYNNLDRKVAHSRYAVSIAPTNLIRYSTTDYDDRNRLYKSQNYYINTDGSLGPPLSALNWYDPNGNTQKQTQQGASAVTKSAFDSLDRPQVIYVVAEASSSSDENTNSVILDTVISQQINNFNAANQLLSITEMARFDDATGTGSLQGPSGAQPASRNTYIAYYLDPIGNLRYTAAFGTNGSAPWSYPVLHPVSSALVLVSEQRYAPDGDVSAWIDAMGTVSTEIRDSAGRAIQKVQNAGSLDNRRVSNFAYAADGGLSQLLLENSTTGLQVTTWAYGSDLATSGVERSDLLVSKTFPTGESAMLTYNRQGEIATSTDPNGTIHIYERDELGRLINDRVVALAPGLDASVQCIGTNYDLRGHLSLITSYAGNSPGSSIVNQVMLGYNGIDCLIADTQSSVGAVVPGTTPSVDYTCTAAIDGILRRKSVIYPNGRNIAYEYGDSGSVDDVLNRVQSVHDSDLTVLAEYQFIGASTPSVTTLPQPNIIRTWKRLPGELFGDGGDPYTGYDRFGRTEWMRWVQPQESAYTSLVNVQWGYNQASLKTWRRDVLALESSAAQDQAFAYDGLYQVKQRQEGILNLNLSAIGGTASQIESFRYDETGNWIGYQQQNVGQTEIDQTRVNNQSNQVTQVDGSSAGVSYDRNGNMLDVPMGEALSNPSNSVVWDAWNRPVNIYNTDNTLISQFRYDGMGRRISMSSNGVSRYTYFDDQWRSIEERTDDIETAERQHIWCPSNRGDMILRDRSTGNSGDMNERLYPMKDQLDPVAISNINGAIVERYAYSAFGNTTFLNSDFTPRSSNISGYLWEFLFHAEFQDADTGWFNYGFRYYSPQLGRWLSRDPIGEAGGLNIMSFVQNSPLNLFDLLGLASCIQQYRDCFSDCFNSGPCPWEDSDSTPAQNKNARYRYCQEQCQAAYMECKASRKKKQTSQSQQASQPATAPSFCDQHPLVCGFGAAVAVATVVVVVVVAAPVVVAAASTALAEAGGTALVTTAAAAL